MSKFRDIPTRELVARLAAAETPKQLKFSVCIRDGWVTSSSREVVDLLVEVWNRRKELFRAPDGSRNGQDPKGLDGEAATAGQGAQPIANRSRK